ncbi:predicted protein [Histoplasma mississippiense (nom. inval.)]|uniref:predicted protein n=1 Tax=Ajellomyces capsulatus (strain NAm1 / WU24) TaxID=2059318 RepID=UPI000157C36F|nr:predicted protein [Histoplasma mississippiense (nom. inval.)]EDN07265.1 predicted protein [Histoplasma mississippiense (nom. inval.)]
MGWAGLLFWMWTSSKSDHMPPLARFKRDYLIIQRLDLAIKTSIQPSETLVKAPTGSDNVPSTASNMAKGDRRKRASQLQQRLQKPSLKQILSMNIEDMPQLVMSYAGPDSIDKQQDVIQYCLQRILQGPRPDPECTLQPRIEQVRILRRMIYGYSDTLFIARTGYGKSLILQSYTILTGKITIQLVPLNKLGDQQTRDIARFPGANPCLVSADNLQGQEDLLKRIQQGEYTHILLSPEQALCKRFQHVLQDPTLQEKIGLVAIDECHLVTQWSQFRSQFARLGHLRLLLREDIVWFGCSATLSSKAEDIILQEAGFRSIGVNPRQTQVIRTSINRPDIFIGVHPIPRGKLVSYDMLYFLLNEAIDTDGKIIPQHILKTIVFIDSHVKVQQAVQYFRSILLQICQNNRQNVNNTDTSFINDTIQHFTSRVSEVDQNIRFEEFMKPKSMVSRSES